MMQGERFLSGKKASGAFGQGVQETRLFQSGRNCISVKNRMTRNEEVQEIDLIKLFREYLKRWWLIVLCVLIAGGGALFGTKKFVTPLYQASITVYVNNTRSGEYIDYISGSNLQASQKLVSTYSNIIISDTVLTKVAAKAGKGYTAESLRKLLTTQQISDTELFNVFIRCEDPEEAAYLANTVAKVAPKELEAVVEGSSAKVVDYAKVPEKRYSPNYSRNTILGVLLGLVLSVGYITIRSLLDVRIKEDADLLEMFDIPVLGQIPHFSNATSGKKGE